MAGAHGARRWMRRHGRRPRCTCTYVYVYVRVRVRACSTCLHDHMSVHLGVRAYKLALHSLPLSLSAAGAVPSGAARTQKCHSSPIINCAEFELLEERRERAVPRRAAQKHSTRPSNSHSQKCRALQRTHCAGRPTVARTHPQGRWRRRLAQLRGRRGTIQAQTQVSEENAQN